MGNALTIYGITSCDTCRRALAYLRERDIDHRFHDLRSDGLDIQMLERWADRIDWEKLVNRRSLTWRRLPETDRNGIDRSRAFAIMLDQPTLVKRPVLEGDQLLAVGFSERRFDDYLARRA